MSAIIHKYKSWLILCLLAIVWGSSFILMKLGMEAKDGTKIFSGFQVGSLRMLIAGGVLFPFAIKYRKLITNKNIIPLLITGFMGNFFPAFLFPFAEEELDSSFAGMLNSTVPVFATLIAVFVFKVKLQKLNWLGLLIGIIGAVCLTFAGGETKLSGDITHIGAILIATLCYAISVNTIKFYLADLKAFAITSISFSLTLIPAIISIFVFNTPSVLESNPFAFEGLGYIAFLAIIGTALAVLLFNYLISISSPIFGASVTYLIPIVAILWGLLFDEAINYKHFICMGILLSGVFLLNKKAQKKAD